MLMVIVVDVADIVNLEDGIEEEEVAEGGGGGGKSNNR